MRWMWFAALLSTACVSKGRYELLEIQLDATRTAMSARSAQGVEDARALEERIVELEQEIAERQAQLDALLVAAGERDEAMATVHAELVTLRAELEGLRGDAVVDPEAPGVEVDPELAAGLDALQREREAAAAAERAAAAVHDAFEAIVASDRLTLRDEPERGVVVAVVPLGQLFQEGWTTLSPRGEVLAADLAEALRQLPGRDVRVEGHTDARPRHSAEFASNWERGFASALVVARVMESEQVGVALSVASYGGLRPLIAGEGREAESTNNRIELVIDANPATLPAYAPNSIGTEPADEKLTPPEATPEATASPGDGQEAEAESEEGTK